MELDDLLDLDKEEAIEGWRELGLIIIRDPDLAKEFAVGVEVNDLLDAIRAGVVPAVAIVRCAGDRWAVDGVHYPQGDA